MTASPPLVLGIDAGATATRALVAGTDGTRHGFGRAGGGNPTAHPPDQVAAALAAALRDALVDVDPADVGSAVVGLAGVLTQPRVAAAFDTAWRGAGLRCPMRVVSDTAVAFAAGTSQPAGTVLIAGTGAVAAAIVARDVRDTAGGHGWLLGDEGSGFWLGREAARAVLADLDGRGHVTALTDPVLATVLDEFPAAATGAAARNAVITAVHARPPVELSRLAPAVTRAARDGDGVARRLVSAAAGHLVDHVAAVHEPADTRPVVLAGSLLTEATPVADSVRRRLRRRYRGPVETARDAAAGAAWLAALDLPDVAASGDA